jgi:hypothetical protein
MKLAFAEGNGAIGLDGALFDIAKTKLAYNILKRVQLIKDAQRSRRPDPVVKANTKLPLAGIRVLDLATFIGGPFCGSLLAEFGAEVIKVEQPGKGSPLRRFGIPSECVDSLTRLSEARNRKSMR